MWTLTGKTRIPTLKTISYTAGTKTLTVFAVVSPVGPGVAAVTGVMPPVLLARPAVLTGVGPAGRHAACGHSACPVTHTSSLDVTKPVTVYKIPTGVGLAGRHAAPLVLQHTRTVWTLDSIPTGVVLAEQHTASGHSACPAPHTSSLDIRQSTKYQQGLGQQDNTACGHSACPATHTHAQSGRYQASRQCTKHQQIIYLRTWGEN